MTAQLILAAGEREEPPQLEKGAHCCHHPRGTFPAVGANPVRGSEGHGAGGLGTHTAAMLCPCAAPATWTAGALCFCTRCWGQSIAGLRCSTRIWLARAACAYWWVPRNPVALQRALLQRNAAQRSVAPLCSHTARILGKDALLSLLLCRISSASPASPAARHRFRTRRVLQGHPAFPFPPQPVQDPNPSIPQLLWEQL